MGQENSKKCIICGDLNLILNAYEKQGQNFQAYLFRDKLENIMDENNVMDIQPKNIKYTWSNKRLGPGNIKEKLDIFWIHDKIIPNFNSMISNIIPSVASDHKPIAIKFGASENYGPLHFRYIPLWINSENVKTLIARAWNQIINGTPSFVRGEKFKKCQKNS